MSSRVVEDLHCVDLDACLTLSVVSGVVQARREVRRAIGGRRLIWFGTRGEDAEGLGEIPELAGSFALIAPLRHKGQSYEIQVCLEELRGARPDTYTYELDLDRSEEARAFRREMLHSVREPCVIMTYGSSALVSALAFSMASTVTVAGPFNERQIAFHHKPWVECALADRGIRGVQWQYVAYEHQATIKDLVAREPHVLRASRTAGGVGLALARDEDDVDRFWSERTDPFVAVAPLVEGTPINFSGCVFADGSVRLHPASVQLIGIPSCTDQPFGYCGNDFGALAGLLTEEHLGQIDRMGRQIGSWLHGERYLGAFGVDAIVAGGAAVFTELNPRFQGSSALTATIARELDVSDLYTDHLAASLGLAAPSSGLSIAEWAKRQPALSRVVVHNTAPARVIGKAAEVLTHAKAEADVSQLAKMLPVDPGGALYCLTMRRSVTHTGFELDLAAERLIASLCVRFAPVA